MESSQKSPQGISTLHAFQHLYFPVVGLRGQELLSLLYLLF